MDNNEKPREYTMTFGDVKVVKTANELTGAEIFACEKIVHHNQEIGRLNTALADNVIIRDHYKSVAEPVFKASIEKEAGADDDVAESIEKEAEV
tara:strand:+ start:307 stop:588 length:282 start_codon:yes stop_codon:yes gene_type:complete